MAKEYSQRSACLTFFYVVLAETKFRFNQEKSEHYQLSLISEVFDKNGINWENQCVKEWNHVIPLPAYFRLNQTDFHPFGCKIKSDACSVTTIMNQYADTTFSLNM